MPPGAPQPRGPQPARAARPQGQADRRQLHPRARVRGRGLGPLSLAAAKGRRLLLEDLLCAPDEGAGRPRADRRQRPLRDADGALLCRRAGRGRDRADPRARHQGGLRRAARQVDRLPVLQRLRLRPRRGRHAAGQQRLSRERGQGPERPRGHRRQGVRARDAGGAGGRVGLDRLQVAAARRHLAVGQVILRAQRRGRRQAAVRRLRRLLRPRAKGPRGARDPGGPGGANAGGGLRSSRTAG